MIRALFVVGGLLLPAGCGNDGSALPPALESTTTAVSTTVATDQACTIDPGPIQDSPLITPPNANTECDAGWRIFFWIGESGDPIYRLQHLDQDEWVDVDHDVACDLDAALLSDRGVPSNLADPWGDKFSGQCG